MNRRPRIYVASSWRNEHQPWVVQTCRAIGLDTYDFRNPSTGGPLSSPGLDGGFSWADVSEDWQSWNADTYRLALETHPLAQKGFQQDMAALEWADVTLMVMPCGRSSHLELGWAAGAEKMTAIYYPPGIQLEPELMARMATSILVGTAELGVFLRELREMNWEAA